MKLTRPLLALALLGTAPGCATINAHFKPAGVADLSTWPLQDWRHQSLEQALLAPSGELVAIQARQVVVLAPSGERRRLGPAGYGQLARCADFVCWQDPEGRLMTHPPQPAWSGLPSCPPVSQLLATERFVAAVSSEEALIASAAGWRRVPLDLGGFGWGVLAAGPDVLLLRASRWLRQGSRVQVVAPRVVLLDAQGARREFALELPEPWPHNAAVFSQGFTEEQIYLEVAGRPYSIPWATLREPQGATLRLQPGPLDALIAPAGIAALSRPLPDRAGAIARTRRGLAGGVPQLHQLLRNDSSWRRQESLWVHGAEGLVLILQPHQDTSGFTGAPGATYPLRVFDVAQGRVRERDLWRGHAPLGAVNVALRTGLVLPLTWASSPVWGSFLLGKVLFYWGALASG